MINKETVFLFTKRGLTNFTCFCWENHWIKQLHALCITIYWKWKDVSSFKMYRLHSASFFLVYHVTRYIVYSTTSTDWIWRFYFICCVETYIKCKPRMRLDFFPISTLSSLSKQVKSFNCYNENLLEAPELTRLIDGVVYLGFKSGRWVRVFKNGTLKKGMGCWSCRLSSLA